MGFPESPAVTRADRLRARDPGGASALQSVDESDDDLMARVAAGDADACRVVVEGNLRRILGLATRTLGDRAEAEDVAQEAFLRLWSRAAEWRPGTAKIATWLHRVTVNLCLDWRKRRHETLVADPPDPPDDAADAVRLLEEKDLARRVREEIMRLTATQRMAITLCHYQGIRNTEAAKLMNITVEALESLLARARRTLRERLRGVAVELFEGAE